MYLYYTISFSVILFQNLKTKTHFIKNIMLDVTEEEARFKKVWIMLMELPI